jgi:hypothetical protein
MIQRQNPESDLPVDPFTRRQSLLLWSEALSQRQFGLPHHVSEAFEY